MGVVNTQGPAGPLGQGWNTRPDQFPTVVGSFTSKSKVNDVVQSPTYGCPSVFVALNGIGTITSLICQFEVSDNGSDWFVCYGLPAVQATAGTTQVVATGNFSAVTGLAGYYLPTGGAQFARLRVTTAQAGTGVFQIRLTPFNAPAQIAVNILSNAATLATNTQALAGFSINANNIVYQASQTSAIANGTTTRTTTTGLGIYHTLNFLLNITAAGAATGTLQIFCEDSQDGGTTWDDLWASNTFVFGSAVTTQRFVVNGFIASSITQGSAQATETLAAGTARQGPFGDRVRIREVVTLIAGSPTGVTYTINGVAHL